MPLSKNRREQARENLIRIFNDSAAMEGNEEAFRAALREYTAAVVEATLETMIKTFQDVDIH